MNMAEFGNMAIKLLIGFVVLYVVIFVTGRTSISKLTPFQFVFAVVLGGLVSGSIYQRRVGVVHLLFAVAIWTILAILGQYLTQNVKRVRPFMVGNPAIIIRDGVIDRKLVKKYGLDINQLLSILRQRKIFSVREVQYGILEANGEVSTILASKYEKPTKQDLKLPETPVDIPTSLIIDGKVLKDNLHERGFDEQWLNKELKAKGYNSPANIYYAEWKNQEGMHISPK